MSDKIKIICIFALATTVVIALQALWINRISEERDRYRDNSAALLENVEHYRTSESLAAARVATLSLKLNEMERYRAADLKTIEQLNIRKRDLEQITTAQTRTIAELRGFVKDTVIIYRDRIVRDTAEAIHVSNEWVDFHGIISDGCFDGTLEVRDSLLIVESVERARFLGFLWRTHRVKSRAVDVTTRNPYTEILGIESIRIEK